MNSDQASGVADHINRTKKELLKIIKDLAARILRLENEKKALIVKGEPEIIYLSYKDFKAFEEAMKNPKPPNKKLVDAFKRHKKEIK